MCPKFMTPHLFDCKNVTEGNMTPKQKWSHMTQDILGKTLMWPQITTCMTSAHTWQSIIFFPLWLSITKLLIVSPNELDQISLPQTLMPPMTTFHHSQFHCSIWVEVGQILGWTFWARKVGVAIDLFIDHNLWPHKKLYVTKCQLVGLKQVCSWPLK